MAFTLTGRWLKTAFCVYLQKPWSSRGACSGAHHCAGDLGGNTWLEYLTTTAWGSKLFLVCTLTDLPALSYLTMLTSVQEKVELKQIVGHIHCDKPHMFCSQKWSLVANPGSTCRQTLKQVVRQTWPVLSSSVEIVNGPVHSSYFRFYIRLTVDMHSTTCSNHFT